MSREKRLERAAVSSAARRDCCRIGGAALDGVLDGELHRDGVGQWVGDHRRVIGGMAQDRVGLAGIALRLDVDHLFQGDHMLDGPLHMHLTLPQGRSRGRRSNRIGRFVTLWLAHLDNDQLTQSPQQFKAPDAAGLLRTDFTRRISSSIKERLEQRWFNHGDERGRSLQR